MKSEIWAILSRTDKDKILLTHGQKILHHAVDWSEKSLNKKMKRIFSFTAQTTNQYKRHWMKNLTPFIIHPLVFLTQKNFLTLGEPVTVPVQFSPALHCFRNKRKRSCQHVSTRRSYFSLIKLPLRLCCVSAVYLLKQCK